MNYLELKNVTAALLNQGLSSRLISFDGGHRWPPPEACTEAIQWLELASFREGRSMTDSQLVDDLFRRETERAEQLERAGELFQAYRTYRDLQTDFRGLHALTNVEKNLSRLEQDKALGDSSKQLEKIEKKESLHLKRLLKEFLAKGNHKSLDWWRQQISAIQELDEQYELVTKRLLEFIWRNGYEKSWFAGKDEAFERAVYLAQISLLVKPKDPDLNYNLARLHALNHHLEAALVTLRLAVASGYSNRERIEEDPAFSPLQKNAEFQEILDGIGSQ